MITEELKNSFNALLELKHNIETNDSLQIEDLEQFRNLLTYDRGEGKLLIAMINAINAEMTRIFEQSIEYNNV